MEIALKNDKFKPLCSNYYLIAKNGIFVCKENQCFIASVNVTDKLSLKDHSEGLIWKLPKIPCRLAYRAISFFRHIRELYQSESLKWRDVDFEQGTVTIQSRDDWHTKNYRSRTIEMTPILYETMLQNRQLHMELRVQVDYVFTYKGYKIKYMDATLKRVVKRAGLQKATLHTLRHTFASQLVMAGVSLMEVQQLMGHRSHETTLQYAHLSEDHVKKQVNRLPFADSYGKNKAKMQDYGNLPRKKPVSLKVVKLNTGKAL